MPAVDHVVVIALENRSFDHMLGFLDHPKPTFDGLRGAGPYTNPDLDGTPVPATDNAKRSMPMCPDHSHDAVMEQLALQPGPGGTPVPTNAGFITSFDRICRGEAAAKFGGLIAPLLNWWKSRKKPPPPVEGRGPLVMHCQSPEHAPVLSTLALEFAVFTRWFCSVPGETWPNRNFLHAATSDGETDINPRFYSNKTIFELLEENKQTWRIYYDDTPQVWAFHELWDGKRTENWFTFDAFAKHVAKNDLPAYTFIEPNHRPAMHDRKHAPVIGSPDISNSQHPGNSLIANDAFDGDDDTAVRDFTRAETLLATIYEALRNNPSLFERTLLLITYDEHGGLYDHVPPPIDVPDPGHEKSLLRRIMRAIYRRQSARFDFHMLGPRVPAVAVSPLIEQHTVDTTVRDHASVPATLRALFAPTAEPLTSRDGWAPSFDSVVTRTTARTDLPDLSAYALHATTPAAAAATGAPTPSLPPGSELGGHVPHHYLPFVRMTDKVGGKLRRRSVPEAKGLRGAPDLQRAQLTTEAFAMRAHRSRAQ